MTATPHDIRTALHTVVDPCSIAANSPLSIVDLGLVQNVRQDGDDVHVTLCLTAPMCLLGTVIARDVEDAVAALDGVSRATVAIDTAAIWTTDRMTDAGRDRLEQRRSTGRMLAPVQPRQWKTTAAENAQP